MATFEKRGKTWRVQVKRGKIRKSSSFITKAEAVAWAAMIEAEILAGKSGAVPNKLFRDLLDRYADEVSVSKRGEKWERLRLALIGRDEISAVRLPELNATHFAAWRDRRLRSVSAASVRREWNLISHACTVAAREWHWLTENPMKLVRRPAPAPGRDRLPSAGEIERLLFALGYDYADPPVTATARVGAAFLFAIETAMRAGEIAGLSWDRVFLDKRFLKTDGKTVAATRDVPLSAEAIRLLNQLPRDGGSVFRLTSANIDALFRKAKARALIVDLHFHDSRHEAITRLAKKLDVLELARMVGHRDLRQLMVYYNETAEALAKKLG